MSDGPAVVVNAGDENNAAEETAEQAAADAVETASNAVATAAAAVDMAAATVEREESEDEELWQALEARFDGVMAALASQSETMRILAEQLASIQGVMEATRETTSSILKSLSPIQSEVMAPEPETPNPPNPSDGAGDRPAVAAKRLRVI